MFVESFFSWLTSAFSTGVGAFVGALGAYLLACRKENNRKKTEYLCLLLIVYDHLEALCTTFTDALDAGIKEINGERVVEFDLPLPELDITNEQIQTLMEVAPDKQMPSTLIHLQHFLKSNAKRVAKDGSQVLSLDSVNHYVHQLQFMLLSVRTQYEQAANGVFPLDESTRK